MGFFKTFGEDENSEAGIRSRMQKEKRLYIQRLIDKAEYEERMTALEAQLAALTENPAAGASASEDDRLKELNYLLSKKWISPEDYVARKREILGENS